MKTQDTKLQSKKFFIYPITLLLLISPHLNADDFSNRAFCPISLQTSTYAQLLNDVQSGGKTGGIYDTFTRFNALRAQNAKILDNAVDPEGISILLRNPEETIFHDTISDWIKTLESKSGAITQADIDQALEAALQYRVPRSQVSNRIKQLKNLHVLHGIPEKMRGIRYAFGELSLEDLQLLVHGNSALRPTSDSLIGMYMKEAQAQSVVKRFPQGPVDRTTPLSQQTGIEYGPEKYVVAVSAESFPIYQKYFKRPEFLIHVHNPGQGTLQLGHNGKVGTYASMGSEMRFPSAGTIMPHILLKTTEAQRATQFFKLSANNLGTYAEYPWSLFGYCAPGGYESCTHWVGNIPLGDDVVSSYKLPGKADSYAYNSAVTDPGPQIRELRDYSITQEWLNSSISAENRELIKRVWKVPGHKQLAELLGANELQASFRGEYANPGWVALRLTGWVERRRVPFVFLSVADHKAAIPADFNPQISAK